MPNVNKEHERALSPISPESSDVLRRGHLASIHDPITGKYLVILEGKPAAGKTTVGDRAVRMKIPGISMVHMSAGDTLRGIASGNIASEYGKELRLHADALGRHEVLPHDIVESVVEEAIAHLSEDVVILDGYPRFVEQLEGFVGMTARVRREVAAVVDINAPDEVVLQRMLARETRDGEDPYTRETIEARLAQYHDEVDPTFDALAEKLGIERHHIITTANIDASANALREIIAEAVTQ